MMALNNEKTTEFVSQPGSLAILHTYGSMRNYLPCSSKNLSASMAAMQPVPAAVIAWR